MTTEVEVLVDHLSFSQLRTWASCGEQHRLERFVRVPRRPSWYFIGGTALHECTETYDLRSLGVDVPDVTFDEVFERLTAEAEEESGLERSEFRASGRATKEFPNKEDADWWLKNGPSMVNRWITWRRNCPWEPWVGPGGEFGIELPFDLHLQQSAVIVHGRIDRIFVDPATGHLIVVDLKTGSRPEVTPRQLGTYKVGFEQAFPDAGPLQYGAFWDARKGATSQVYSLEPYTMARLEYQYGALRFARENGVFVPNPAMCSSCSVNEFCYEYDPESAAAHGVPLPWEVADEPVE